MPLTVIFFVIVEKGILNRECESSVLLFQP